MCSFPVGLDVRGYLLTYIGIDSDWNSSLDCLWLQFTVYYLEKPTMLSIYCSWQTLYWLNSCHCVHSCLSHADVNSNTRLQIFPLVLIGYVARFRLVSVRLLLGVAWIDLLPLLKTIPQTRQQRRVVVDTLLRYISVLTVIVSNTHFVNKVV